MSCMRAVPSYLGGWSMSRSHRAMASAASSPRHLRIGLFEASVLRKPQHSTVFDRRRSVLIPTPDRLGDKLGRGFSTTSESGQLRAPQSSPQAGTYPMMSAERDPAPAPNASTRRAPHTSTPSRRAESDLALLKRSSSLPRPVSIGSFAAHYSTSSRDTPSAMAPQWTHLIRFIAKEDGQIHLGQIDAAQYPDVGIAVFEGKEVAAKEVTGGLFDGVVTERVLHVDKLLSPVTVDQVPLIRCLGLNYRDHAKEANMPIPNEPILFIKPRTALNGPFPAKINVPKVAQDGTSDYEAELTIVIAKDGKDIPEDKALDYVLGYTCGNDVSARAQQFKNSQWCFSKGFDGSAPVGPVLVSGKAIGDPHQLDIKAIHNKNVVQDSNTKEMIFNIAKTVSFLSIGTTLEKGTLIMTGTGPGVGAMRNPKVVLQNGDDMRVHIQGIGTLINEVYYE